MSIKIYSLLREQLRDQEVGNDLFNNVLSIKRIICPSHHAFSKVDAIQQAILDHAPGRIILLMLGPTAKILAYRLSQLGYRALDLGHIIQSMNG